MPDLHKLIEANKHELTFEHGSVQWELVRIEPGEFVMGSPLREVGREEGEVPQMRVGITHPFYLGKYQVTQAQWRSIMGTSPSEFQGDNLAVDQIQYSEALDFCKRLSRGLGLNVTLPSEAEWEFAARAGTTTRYYSGDSDAGLDAIAWFRDNSGERVHEVGRKTPNAWGLYDMLGNVYQPTRDYITSFDKLSQRDPEGNRLPTHGAMRGGAWMEPAARCRVAARLKTTSRFGGMGVRIAIEP